VSEKARELEQANGKLTDTEKQVRERSPPEGRTRPSCDRGPSLVTPIAQLNEQTKVATDKNNALTKANQDLQDARTKITALMIVQEGRRRQTMRTKAAQLATHTDRGANQI
jgi:hypothetical protein